MKKVDSNNGNEKKGKKIIILIIIAVFLIFIGIVINYNYGVWISYKENNPTKGVINWNTSVSYDIKVTKSGVIKNYSNKEKLSKEELEKLKKFVKKLKNSYKTKNSNSEGKLSIDGRKYNVSNLSEEEQEIYKDIIDLIKR